MGTQRGLTKDEVFCVLHWLPEDLKANRIRHRAFHSAYRDWEENRPEDIAKLKHYQRNIDRFNLALEFKARETRPDHTRIVSRIDYLSGMDDAWQLAKTFGKCMGQYVIDEIRALERESILNTSEWVVLVAYGRFNHNRGAEKLDMSVEEFKSHIESVKSKDLKHGKLDIYDQILNPENKDYIQEERRHHPTQ